MTTNTPLWQPTRERIAQANITEFTRRVADATGRSFASRLSRAVALVERRARGVLARGLGFRRRRRRARRTYARRCDTGCRARAGFRTRASISPRTCSPRAAATMRRTRSCFAARTAIARRITHAELAATGVADGGGAEGRRAWRRATASPPTFRTCPRRSSRCWARRRFGAVWSSCSPDFGVRGVLDRFGQIEPRVLFTVDGYWYNGKALPIVDKVARNRRRAADGRAGDRGAVSRTLRRADRQTLSRDSRRRPLGRLPRAARGRRRSSMRACRSTIRSTSCTRRARPACRSASSTARAARCCST